MLRCQIVLVKFMEKGTPMQEIRALQITSSKDLKVSVTDRFLVIDFMAHKEFSVKQICFNLDDVKEYACEGVTAP